MKIHTIWYYIASNIKLEYFFLIVEHLDFDKFKHGYTDFFVWSYTFILTAFAHDSSRFMDIMDMCH